MSNIKTYIVGGAVRDTLLDRHVKDIDYVVVGATPTIMLELGFTPVGIDFTVFLHETTGDEYALARTERKIGSGHNGVVVNYNTKVTLEEDLLRRDLTINTLCVSIDDWEEFQKTKSEDLVIDMFNGIQDLKDGILRHVSDAFSDDPVRVLRVARFAARYDFSIDGNTTDLMESLVDSGELNSLTQERVYSEFAKAMMEDHPILFLQVLQDVGAGDILFPELFSDERLPILINESLEHSVLHNRDLTDRLVIITAGLTTETAVSMFERLKAPNDVIKAVKMSTALIRKALDVSFNGLKKNDLKQLLDDVNAWKNVDLFRKVMGVFIIIDNDYLRNLTFNLLKCLKVGNEANFAMLTVNQRQDLKGVEIQQAISDLRLQLIVIQT